MTSRRQFTLAAAAGIAFAGAGPAVRAATAYSSRRPEAVRRRFTSPAVEATIARASAAIGDPEVAWLFANCYPNTLDTTIIATGTVDGKPDTYAITGDIDAMWLRDSAAQVWPYLPLLRQDDALRRMVLGIVYRHARCVLLDPYANAFYRDASQVSEHKDDLTEMRPGVHERKFEVDSLCYVVRLAHGYWKNSGDLTFASDTSWLAAMRALVRTLREQQRRDGEGPYSFRRRTDSPHDTAAGWGRGAPLKPVGLIASVFRPSDDATIFPFLIPSNYFAVQSLRQLAELLRAAGQAPDLATDALALAGEVDAALRQHAVADLPQFGRVLAYEVDGYGSRALLDDSNVPSLLSLPYLGALDRRDPLYARTRRFLTTPGAHPYVVVGKVASGITGPHAGRDMIWPMSIMIRALTTDDEAEIAACLRLLRDTHAGTGFMHEAFHKDDATRFTRPWFAWANSLFGELILRVLAERPALLARPL